MDAASATAPAWRAGRPRTYTLDKTSISYKVVCSSLSGCDRYFDTVPTAAVRLYGTLVTITDDRAPQLTARGSLLTEGFKRGTEGITVSSRDNTGTARAPSRSSSAIPVRRW